jgi:aminoglycoside phosphotransferase (APT) family kinase protein
MSDLGLAWAEDVLGRALLEVEPLVGGMTSTMLRLRDDAGDLWVLRLIDREPWSRHGVELAARERAIQLELAATDLPAPHSHAADPEGTHAGHAAHLMTCLEGRVESTGFDGSRAEACASMLARIHAVSLREQPRDYQTWAPPAKWQVPPWSTRPDLWRQAFALLAGPPPAFAPTFLHRDFHPGNLLWLDDRITGIVDWVETSTGPAALDVAHCRTNLALISGPDAVDKFTAAYREVGQDLADTTYWDVMDLVAFLPTPEMVVPTWGARGLTLEVDVVRRRLEEHLVAVLGVRQR